jgi:carboxymethylenebutenolidase
VVASLPAVAGAPELSEGMVTVATPDGEAEAFFVHPAGGRHPGVLVWPDAWGLRSALMQMARRLAASGYAVLVPNGYYRSTKFPAIAEPIDMRDPAIRERWSTWRALLTPAAVTRDAIAYVAWLDAQPAVDAARRIGTMGYCMGGAMTLRTAAALPGRVGAGASFHGGALVTDGPDSPHLLVRSIKAHYLVAIAESDHEAEPATRDVLRATFAEAGIPAEIEVYEGTLHGWCPPDTLVYDEAQAERAWSRLLALFDEALA